MPVSVSVGGLYVPVAHSKHHGEDSLSLRGELRSSPGFYSGLSSERLQNFSRSLNHKPWC